MQLRYIFLCLYQKGPKSRSGFIIVNKKGKEITGQKQGGEPRTEFYGWFTLMACALLGEKSW